MKMPPIRPALFAALMLTASPALAFDPAQMSDAERDAFGAAVKAYLMENPQVIIEAVNELEARKAAAEAETDKMLVANYKAEIFDDGYSWVAGNPNGDVTLVEFMDYRCGYCRKAQPEVESLLSEDGNIRLIIKEFPILGEASLLSSRFAIATKIVAGDEAYGQVHTALMQMSGDLGEVELRRLADGLGLDTEGIMAQMDSKEVTRVIASNHDLAQRLQINGTPTFILPSQMIRGFVPAAHMEQLIEDERS